MATGTFAPMACGKHMGLFVDALERLAVAVRAVLATGQGTSMPITAAMAIALTEAERAHEEMVRCEACNAAYEKLRAARI